MKLHELKCWPEPFAALVVGRKAFEYRRNDRAFHVGDVLRLREWDPDSEQYTGSMTNRMVRHIVRGPDFGVPEGYCIMSVPLESHDECEREIDRHAKLCDEVVRNRRDYSVEQRALAKKLAEQMRGGGR